MIKKRMKLTENFTLEEFTRSATARRYGMDNKIEEDYIIDNIKELAKVLQIIRNEYNKPIIVDSGYRSVRLNKIVNGARKSDHLFGCAADIHSLTDSPADNKQLFDLIVKMAQDGKIKLR